MSKKGRKKTNLSASRLPGVRGTQRQFDSDEYRKEQMLIGTERGGCSSDSPGG